MAWGPGYPVPPTAVVFLKLHTLIYNQRSVANQNMQVGPCFGPNIQSLGSDLSFRLLFIEY